MDGRGRTGIDFDRLILSEGPDAIVITDAADEVLYWSASAEAMFGYSRSQVVGRQLTSLIVPQELLEERRNLLQKVLEEGAWTYESIHRRADGALIHLDVSSKAVRPQGEEQVLILSTHKDVTDLKVQRDVALVETRFRDLLESVPDAIVMVNHTGRIVLANTQAERMFGYQRSDLLGQPVEMLMPQRLHARHVAHRAGFFSQPHTRPMGKGLELNGRRLNGQEFPVEISLSPIETDEGQLVMSAVRDVSERKRIERMLQEKNEELERAAQAKDRFLATMSHELRTPLNAIIGFTGTLLMKLPGPLTHEQQKQLNTVQSSAKHLLSLINGLLDLAKIESGKVELNLEPVPCVVVIDELVSTLKPLAEKKGLRFDAAVPAREHVIHTDRRAISQIMINLVNNAIKFTDQGAVTISIGREVEQGKAFDAISVTDTGRGIAPEDQRRLFQAFHQLDASSTRREEGTGLGLHLSQKLANLIGGRIEVQSEQGKGSTFTLFIPGH